MISGGASDFIRELAALVAAAPLREKILLVPSYRVGRQWLDAVAAVAGGVANVRTATLGRLMLDCADPGLRRKGLRAASRQEKVRLMGAVLEELAVDGGGEGYFSRLPPGVDLATTLLSTLEELETAAVKNAMGLAAGIAAPGKARELSLLVRNFAAARRSRRIAGQDDIQRVAIKGLSARYRDGYPLLVAPASLMEDLTALEWGFVSRWPVEARARLDDERGVPPEELSFFAADSVFNEAREVLRRIQDAGAPLDCVEVACVDSSVYVPAFCAVGLECFGGRPEDLPMTFNRGIPGHYSRPARLLAAWLEWLEDDLPAEGLARMLDAGLLGAGWRTTVPDVSAEALSARLRLLPLDGSPSDYHRLLGAGGERTAGAEKWLDGWLWDALPLSDDGETLLRNSPERVLDAASRLLRDTGERDGKLDAYARLSLSETIRQWRPFCDWPGFEPIGWLRDVLSGLYVMGLGPMPGRLYVSDLESGGHSGRERMFIVGLDEGRFPGSVRQDPVLLDRERAAVSNGLPRSGRRRERREQAFRRLLGRLPAGATLSYARDGENGREQFPASVFTRLTEERGRRIKSAALRPRDGGASLGRREDWLAVLLARRGNTLDAGDLGPWHPGLAGGLKARRARESSLFTRFDGNVPEAGNDWLAGERALSPTDLETMAACPMDFFFKRILDAAPPERYEPRPGRWLPGNVRGSLLHDLFQDFLDELDRRGRTVTAEALPELRELLGRMLVAAVGRERRRTPVRDALAYAREERELSEACGIFLDSEVDRQRRGRPLCLEASLGGAKEDKPPWNRVAPVELRLKSGATLRLKGRVDRIDRAHDHGGLIIFDYKTGLSDKYSPDDPFRQGRHLQPLLYTRMLETVLAEAGVSEPIQGFAYFFPMPRDEGRTVFYPRGMLGAEGMAIVETLAAMLSTGCFPFTTDARDVAYSDYAPLSADAARLAVAARDKAENDPALRAWAVIRGLAEAGEGGHDDA